MKGSCFVPLYECFCFSVHFFTLAACRPFLNALVYCDVRISTSEPTCWLAIVFCQKPTLLIFSPLFWVSELLLFFFFFLAISKRHKEEKAKTKGLFSSLEGTASYTTLGNTTSLGPRWVRRCRAGRRTRSSVPSDQNTSRVWGNTQNTPPPSRSALSWVDDQAVQMGSCNPGEEIVSSSVNSWPNGRYNRFKWEERQDGGCFGGGAGRQLGRLKMRAA